ncbi:hypothetical protein AUC68_03165 [Methyloceanibacter methanicus]|uniref:ABC transmembrane type-1 domain-containing protein n=1 Tax=Methyloceanibacter methanicus TaxID=1774968 RepID=A0A1E3W2V5_9HYPH|nr:hypothetical protein AUC68_03165 [Methyloceanibacter methanicus]
MVPRYSNLGGAIFIMGAVLYPYVYITARASFVAQSICVIEASRTLGRSASETFWQIALPLARPALAAGTALALMETLNDIGAVEFFGVQTLTVTVYDTWLDRGSLAGAAQISCVMLFFVLAVLGLERALRSGKRFHHTTGKYRDLPEESLSGVKGILATAACAAPILVGFVLPTYVLARDAIVHLSSGLTEDFWRAALHSLGLSLAAAVLGVFFAIVLAYGRRQTQSKFVRIASFVPAVSYAVPGTVLAIGLLIPLAGLDTRSTTQPARCSVSRRVSSSPARPSPSSSLTRYASSPPRSGPWRPGSARSPAISMRRGAHWAPRSPKCFGGFICRSFGPRSAPPR